MGPSVAQDMVETFLPYKAGGENYVTEDIHFIESRLEDYHSRLTGLAAELDALRRYHRQTLQELPMGVCSLAKDQEILMWNKAMEELTGIAAKRVVGSRLAPSAIRGAACCKASSTCPTSTCTSSAWPSTARPAG
jgi:PAS domain-containing protein